MFFLLNIIDHTKENALKTDSYIPIWEGKVLTQVVQKNIKHVEKLRVFHNLERYTNLSSQVIVTLLHICNFRIPHFKSSHKLLVPKY